MNSLESLFNLWLPSPLQELPIESGIGSSCRVYIKRDDLIHYFFSGNKYRKIKYNFQEFLQGNYKEIVAFGGSFSNLLYTLSFLARQSGIPTTFYIRGDGYDPANPTLETIQRNGVVMHFVDRQTYRQKEECGLIHQLRQKHPLAYFIPDGGSNKLATKGAAEILEELSSQLGHDPDHILMDMGTAGTFCGVMDSLPQKTKLTGIPVLKGVDWLKTFRQVLEKADYAPDNDRITILEDYHFGGFSKYNQTLISFINQFNLKYGIPLDPVYTGKLFFALMDLLQKSYFGTGQTIVCIHGGGLQGIAGFNYIHGPLIDA